MVFGWVDCCAWKYNIRQVFQLHLIHHPDYDHHLNPRYLLLFQIPRSDKVKENNQFLSWFSDNICVFEKVILFPLHQFELPSNKLQFDSALWFESECCNTPRSRDCRLPLDLLHSHRFANSGKRGIDRYPV